MSSVPRHKFIINHAFLPPKLPFSFDQDEYASILLKIAHSAAVEFADQIHDSHRHAWINLAANIETWIHVYNDGNASPQDIEAAVLSMSVNDTLMIHVTCQNAALILRKSHDHTTFEAFEVQPLTDDVMAAKNALVRQFPAQSISIATSAMSDASFIKELAFYLHRLSNEQIMMSMEKSTKGGQKNAEERQSQHPMFVTEWLMAVLAARGFVSDPTVTITKRTRDEVYWKKSLKPWRRSAMWTAFKVTVQLSVMHLFGTDGQMQYKNFMLHVLSKISRDVYRHCLDQHDLHCMRTKIALRSEKLGSSTFQFVSNQVSHSIAAINARLLEMHDRMKEDTKLDIGALDPEKKPQEFMLSQSYDKLADIWLRAQSSAKCLASEFAPKPRPLIALDPNHVPTIQKLSSGGHRGLQLLHAIEHWVSTASSSYTTSIPAVASDCCQLMQVIFHYHKEAEIVYAGNPRQLSIMMLCIAELWVMLDKVTIACHPILEQYSPTIPTSFLSPLLLIHSQELTRLDIVEKHLKQRYKLAGNHCPSVFGRITDACLGVRVFDASPKMQILKDQIEKQAHRDRQAHIAKFEAASAQQERLLQSVRQASCDQFFHRRTRKWGHDKYCNRCRTEKKALAMKMDKHEWPLPSDSAQAKAVVFELQVPEAIAAWRDTTWYILQMARIKPVDGQVCHGYLRDYHQLTEHSLGLKGVRLTLASTMKSMGRAHYNFQQLTLDNVVVDHCMKYEFYDSKDNLWAADQVQGSQLSIARFFRSEIGDQASKFSVTAVNETSHHQNTVIAAQSTCPVDEMLLDFVEFGSLRAGGRLQWTNLLRMLLSNQTSINTDLMVLLIEQLACHVGPPAQKASLNIIREHHVDLHSSVFHEKLCEAVNEKLVAIESNWKESDAATALLYIIKRLLASSTTTFQSLRSLKLLRLLRQVCIGWLTRLKLTREERNAATDSRSMSAALTARSTWDLDERFREELFKEVGDVGDFIQCSVEIHDITKRNDIEDTIRRKNDRLSSNALAVRLQEEIECAFESQYSNIQSGLQRFIPGLGSPSTCTFTHATDGLWMTYTVRLHGVVVQLNLLTGQLLYMGKPLTLLPSNYADHELYKQVFGKRVLEVMVSDRSDMDYMTTSPFNGHMVYFGFRNSELWLQLEIDGHRFHALDKSMFTNDVAPLILEDTATALLDLATGCVDFRPLDNPWSMTTGCYVLNFNLDSRSDCSLTRMSKTFISTSSQLGMSICKMLLPLEQSRYVHITRDICDGQVEVSLPRYRLNFVVGELGQLHCRELSSVVASEQDIGTLYGLRSRLLLRSEGFASGRLKDTVLIPYGEVMIVQAKSHVEISVNTSDCESIQFFQYSVDRRLGQLLSNGNLEAHLFKCYLHAVTNHSIPDRLSSRTGIEECLQGLTDSITRTTEPLSERSLQILQLIGNLTPVRRFYPHHKRTMQQVEWHSALSPLSQHDQLFDAAADVISFNKSLSMLFNSQPVAALAYGGHDFLRLRSYTHTAKYHNSTTGSERRLVIEDLIYKSRDRETNVARRKAYETSCVINQWPLSIETQPDLYRMLQQWEANATTAGFHTVFDAASLSDVVNMEFTQMWPSLLNRCMSSSRENLEALNFLFSLLIFAQHGLYEHVKTLLAFATSYRLKVLRIPAQPSYNLSVGYSVDLNTVNQHIDQCMEECQLLPPPYAKIDESETELEERRVAINIINEERKKDHASEFSDQKQAIVAAVKAAWPAAILPIPTPSQLTVIDHERLQKLLDCSSIQWYRNYELSLKCLEFDAVLRAIDGPSHWPAMPESCLPWVTTEKNRKAEKQRSLMSLMNDTNVSPQLQDASDLFKCNGLDSSTTALNIQRSSKSDDEMHRDIYAESQLQAAIHGLESINEEKVQAYGRKLQRSLDALKLQESIKNGRFSLPDLVSLQQLQGSVQDSLESFLSLIRDALGPKLQSHKHLQEVGQWPIFTPLSLLQPLSLRYRKTMPQAWQKVLLSFAQAVSALQRVERIQRLIEGQDEYALHQELLNPGHAEWDVSTYPDWLLLEIQNDMLIRPVQVRVAKEIIENENGSIMLGMGEGKSSVILPMAITALVYSGKLVRVVVPKSLANQMLPALSASLAGLVNRTVYSMPFSRQTTLDLSDIGVLREAYESCKNQNGVILTLPEHLNSFRLMGQDKLDAGPITQALATELLRTQKWLDSNSRDILDECDELLHPSYELVYTNGVPSILQGAPRRWILLTELLSMVGRLAVEISHTMPTALEVEHRGGGVFPHVRILTLTGYDALVNRLLAHIQQGELMGLPLRGCPVDTLSALSEFLVKPDISKKQECTIKAHFKDSALIDSIYILRGLLAGGVLQAGLTKRWCVKYGLDRSRCLSAVPYRAKSVPSMRAEFAQPEMALLLTALSYYYEGIRQEDFRICLNRLFRHPDPADEYHKWIAHSDVPTGLRSLVSVNVEDVSSVQQLHGHLRLNKAVIDFFLNASVFPKEAKQFPFKLSSSAWDLCAADPGRFTSGFSGTGDSILPLTMPQKDLIDLRHTDAAVLCRLLRVENERYLCAQGPKGERLTATELLKFIVSSAKQLSVIIDVGAQFIEDNQIVAQQWLDLRADKQAVVFFDQNDQKVVLDRTGQVQALVSSPYSGQPQHCLYFFDEFHTRGTDFKLPDGFTAAVLLGPGLQKDTFVQACMRMRKVGFSQSILLVGPAEVDNSIRKLLGLDPDYAISTYEAIVWTVRNSCMAVYNQEALWLSRGLAHVNRWHAFQDHVTEDGCVVEPETYLAKLRETESRPLSDLYGATPPMNNASYDLIEEHQSDPVTAKLLLLDTEKHAVPANVQNNDEEQEREVLHEVEQEREIQHPKEMLPCAPQFDEAIYRFIRGEPCEFPNGRLAKDCFSIVRQTTLVNNDQRLRLPRNLFATQDFVRTVVESEKAKIDEFLRPAHWLLKLKGYSSLVLISPYEANEFKPALSTSTTTQLIVYQARTSRLMRCFDNLDTYNIPDGGPPINVPQAVMTTLRLFAGALYFNNFAEYRQYCELLGLWDGERHLDPGNREVQSDLFVPERCRQANGWECNFKESPVRFVRAWTNMRRHGIEWDHTHVGRVLNGQILTELDFE